MKKLKQMVTEVLTASDVVPQLAKYIAKQTGKSEDQILKSITAQTGELKGKKFIRKFFPAEKIEVEESERAVIGIINTSAKDRDREIVDPDGAVLTDYQHNRVVLYAHDYHSLPIGRNMWIKNKPGVGLIAKTEFASRPDDLPKEQPWLPDQVYHLMKSGYLNGFSIGFIPMEERDLTPIETKGGVERAWSKWLMLEYSIVAVPSNPEAVAMEVKSGTIDHPQLLSDLEIEDNEMKTKEPSEETEETYSVSDELGIWAVKTEDSAECLFDETKWTSEDGESWTKTYGERVADILHDEVLKDEKGSIDEEALSIAFQSIIESMNSEGEINIEVEEEKQVYNCECIECGYKSEIEGHCKDTPCPECGGTMRRAERPGPGEPKSDEDKKEVPPEEGSLEEKETGAEADPEVEKIAEPVSVSVGLSDEIKDAIKGIREEITELKEGKVLSKATRGLVEKAVEALKELLEKADSRIQEVEEVEEEVEKEFEIELPPEEPGITKEQIKELLQSPEAMSFIKEKMATLTGKR